MKQEYILQIIQGPLVTEKSSSATAKKQLVFKVARKATKEEIKEAVEQLLEVTVVAVNTIMSKVKVSVLVNAQATVRILKRLTLAWIKAWIWKLYCQSRHKEKIWLLSEKNLHLPDVALL